MKSIGKRRGLTRLASEDGHFTMVAVDQRPPLIEAISEARSISPEAVAFEDMLLAKRLLVRALADEASSMLLDPNFALPAALDILPARTGLIVTLEDHRFEETPTGRKSRPIDNWSVEKIRRMGGDAVKILAWFRPDASPDIVEYQKAFVRGVATDCRHHDIPHILELLLYPFPDGAVHTADYVESPDERADLVIESVREFAKPEYAVDLFKLETPVPGAALPPLDDSIAARTALQAFETLDGICRDAGVPWVLLSGGAAPDQFERVLTYAYAAGAQGFLAGRTIWLDAVRSHFPDEAAVLSALEGDGKQRLRKLKSLTQAKAKPFHSTYDFAGIGREGDFARLYA